MSTKHQESVRWHILKDRDGRVYFTSDRGAKYTCQNTDEAQETFQKLVNNTMDVIAELLSRDMSTIKFYVEF